MRKELHFEIAWGSIWMKDYPLSWNVAYVVVHRSVHYSMHSDNTVELGAPW